MTKELATYVRGWKSYFGFSQTPSVLRKLEEWMRRRLRSVIWKQWKRSKVRYVRLRQRNIGHDSRPKPPAVPMAPGGWPTAPLCKAPFRSPTSTRSAYHALSQELYTPQPNRTAVCGPACTVVWPNGAWKAGG